MGGRTKSGCCLGILKVNYSRHSYFSIMKLENYGPTGECLNNNHLTLQSLCLSVFCINFEAAKGTKMVVPNLNF